MKRIAVVLGLLLTLALSVRATEWSPVERTCPICKHKHEYQEIVSYGSYIYSWPSKYQYVFWPLTDNPSVYCCPVCHFSAYMWDFDKVPESKVDTLTKFLQTVKLDKEYKDYQDIPMTTRLEIAENVYKIIEQKSEFWCKFYRVLGYHYDQDKNAIKAKESRLKALETAKQMLADTTYRGQEKEILFIAAAMHNFVGQKDSALAYLDKASALTYKNKSWKVENAKGLDGYLSDLIKQYKEFIRKEDEK
ncbi:DUF2225 domain-containing protein [uncultured Acetobacteroides sp.]|uniref:DUF2225 domain-containing protein n=1 Tax=uncultured Acetobacteroides sp. TaxID=1760811 RepID=UPI0029F5B647|nr:DUF2225 domain-containing protein [uncultured Acetobacteroides sp.]